MPDDAPRWFDDDLDVERPRRRPPLLLAAAVLPWLVVAALVLRGTAPGPTSPPTPAGAEADVAGASSRPSPSPPAGALADADATDAAEAAGPDPTDGTPHGSPEVTPEVAPDGAPPHEAGEPPTLVQHGEAEAVVVALTRAWLSDAGPDLAVPGIAVDRRGYLEHVAVDRIELEPPDLAVATVTVVLLVREADAYSDVLVRRAAVPLTVTPTSVHPAGPPWWLPTAPDLTPVPPATDPVEDPAALHPVVLAALEDAGYRAPTLGELTVTSRGTIVAEVVATTPTGEQLDGPVWLATTDAGVAVLGHRADGHRRTGPPAAPSVDPPAGREPAAAGAGDHAAPHDPTT